MAMLNYQRLPSGNLKKPWQILLDKNDGMMEPKFKMVSFSIAT